MQFVDLAHGVVEDAGDDAAVAVARGSGVAFAESEAADEGLAWFVENEFEAHALGIVLAADEAVVLLHFDVAGVVALGFGGHGKDFILRRGGSCQLKVKSFNRRGRGGRTCGGRGETDGIATSLRGGIPVYISVLEIFAFGAPS